jgi:hypothetical protein
MRLLLVLLFLGSAVIIAGAQNRAAVKGTVLDSATKKPLEFVTVALLRVKDTSLLSYTITDKNGAFMLRNLRQDEPSRLLISYVGYQSLHVDPNLRNAITTDLGSIFLTSKVLKEVTITGEAAPVVIKKDTLEFNAEAFKVRPNAVVEDLLKKLPGMQVDHTGQITVNGRDISKIKIDGKDFFANDPKIVTRNLDADMISKVQVYDDRENDPDHLVPDYQVKKVINLKFKKAIKKSTIGRFAGAGGTEDRYYTNGFLAKFMGDMQIGATGNSNNLNETGIFSDNGENSNLRADPSGSLKTSTKGSVNFTDKIGTKLKLNGTYTYTNDINTSASNVNRKQFVGDTTFNTLSVNNNHHSQNSHSFYGRAEWGSDTCTSIKYSPSFYYSNSNSSNSSIGTGSNNYLPLMTKSIASGNSDNNSVTYGHDLQYYTRLNRKGESFSIINNLSLNSSHGINYSYNDLVSYVAALQSDTLNRYGKNINHSDRYGLNIAWHYPLTKKLSLTMAMLNSFSSDGGDLFTYQQDLQTGQYSIFLQDQSNNLVRKQWTEALQPELMYQFKDGVSVKIGGAAQIQEINNHFNNYTADLDQRFNNFLPKVELQINKVTFSYNEELRQPSINDLQPITIVYSQLFSFVGNPALKPTHVRNFNVNLWNFNAARQVSYGLAGHIAIESNSILRERTINPTGAEVTTPINRNGRFTTSVYGWINKSFKKRNDWQIKSQTFVNGIAGHNFFEVNHQDGYQNTVAITVREELTASWKDAVELRPAYSIMPAVTAYQLVDYKNSSYITHKAEMAADIRLPKKLIWSVAYAYTYNPLVAEGFQKSSNLLSLSFGRQIQSKDRGELRITCYDLLNQSISTYHYATENTINDIQNQSLRRYFLLSYSYHFNKTITK